MSLAEFALPSLEKRSREIKPYGKNKVEFNEIKSIIHLIQEERRKTSNVTNQRGKGNSHNNLNERYGEDGDDSGNELSNNIVITNNTVVTNAASSSGDNYENTLLIQNEYVAQHTPLTVPDSNSEDIKNEHIQQSHENKSNTKHTKISLRPKSARIGRQIGGAKNKAIPSHHFRPPYMVQAVLQHQQTNRELSFEVRDQRIDNAKLRRHALRHDQLQKLEENLQCKEQQRLDYLTLKKKEYRQAILITSIIFVSTTRRWLYDIPEIIEQFRYTKSLNDAARKIQSRWKKEMFLRKAMEARLIRKKLKKICWRLQIWSRCARRRLNAKIIRRLFIDFSSNPLPYLIHNLLSKVMKAQKMMRSFIECKYARIAALELSWVELERGVISDNSGGKRRRKNALEEFTERKILTKCSENQRKEGKNGFTNVVSDVLFRPSSATGSGHKEKNSIERDLYASLCRFHLEDSRRSHVNQAGVREVKKMPAINQNHAIMLLAGEDLDQNIYPLQRKWPLFSLLRSNKERLRSTIKEIHRDEIGGRRRVEEQLGLEAEVNRANTFASQLSQGQPNDSDFTYLQNENIDLNSLNELQIIFQLIDTDGDDKISCIELMKLFYVLGSRKDHTNNPQKNVMDEIFQGNLDFKTFAISVNNCSKKDTKYSKEMVLHAFQFFEKETVNEISGADLFHILQSYDGKWNEASADSIMRNAGFTITKNLDYREFVSTLYSVWACENASEILSLYRNSLQMPRASSKA